MGIYSEYLDKNLNFESLSQERKTLLKKIASIRCGHDILVYAVDINKRAPVSMDNSDIIPFTDLLSDLKGNENIDIILHTPGGLAEVVQKLVSAIRAKYKNVSVIVPGMAMSAGTIFSMSANEILMGKTSSLGPIDAQMVYGGKQYSAEAFLSGLEKIKQEVQLTGKLNPVYIPILQNITPGELQEYENAQELSKALVTDWLVKYKFSDWKVDDKKKSERAEEIAKELGNHSKWLTHSRPLGIEDLRKLKLKITDYTENPELEDAITRYFVLLSMTFDKSGIYKLYENTERQIARFVNPPIPNSPVPSPIKREQHEILNIPFVCPNCHQPVMLQGNFDNKTPIVPGAIHFPENNIFICPTCHAQHNLQSLRMNIEAQIKRKIL